MKHPIISATAVLLAASVQAADPQAGREMAGQCAGCHGAEGVSVEDAIPNLAAQKSAYLIAQLKAFRAGDRKNPLMNAVAAQLSDEEIENLATHFAALPGAEPGVAGAGNNALSGARPVFPADYKDTFTRYHTISFPDRGQVRHYYANKPALEAAKGDGPLPDGAFLLVEVYKARAGSDGQPVKGADGHFEEGDLIVYTAMQKEAGWGDEVPAILQNGDWRYAVFSTDGQNRPGLNEGSCLACHQPESKIDYTFTLPQLREKAGG